MHYDRLDADIYYDYDGTEHKKFHPKGLPPASAISADVSAFTDYATSSLSPKSSAQRSWCSIVYHREWLDLLEDCQRADAVDPNSTVVNRATSHFISCSAEYATSWQQVMPFDLRHSSAEHK